MHRMTRHKRLQLSSETIRTLRRRELGMVDGAAAGYDLTVVTMVDDCSKSADDTKGECIIAPPDTYGPDCKAGTHP